MSVNPLTHLSNTICYIDKPSSTKAEQDRLASIAKQPSDLAVSANKKSISSNAIDPINQAEKSSDPGPTINATGQAIGTILSVKA